MPAAYIPLALNMFTFISMTYKHAQQCLELHTSSFPMDKLQLTRRNQSRVFNSRSGRVHAMQLHFYETKLTNLKLKTRPKQLLGYFLLDIALPGSVTKLGENLTFGYFLFENFCTNEQFNIWFMVGILTFSTNWMEMYWIFFFG
jgi:hypothetical protein